jgi:hypothetical protein
VLCNLDRNVNTIDVMCIYIYIYIYMFFLLFLFYAVCELLSVRNVCEALYVCMFVHILFIYSFIRLSVFSYPFVQSMWIFPGGGRDVISGEADTTALNII